MSDKENIKKSSDDIEHILNKNMEKIKIQKIEQQKENKRAEEIRKTELLEQKKQILMRNKIKRNKALKKSVEETADYTIKFFKAILIIIGILLLLVCLLVGACFIAVANH